LYSYLSYLIPKHFSHSFFSFIHFFSYFGGKKKEVKTEKETWGKNQSHRNKKKKNKNKYIFEILKTFF